MLLTITLHIENIEKKLLIILLLYVSNNLLFNSFFNIISYKSRDSDLSN